jgi:hypothetical protein
MMKPLACMLIVALIGVAPIAATARPGGGGGGARPSGGTARPATGTMQPSTRPASPSRPSGSGGFNLNRDVTGPATPNRGNASAARPSGGTNVANRPSGGANRPTTLPADRTTSPSRPSGGNGNTINGGGNGNTINRGGNTINGGNNINVSGNTINRNVYVANPIYRGPAWGWNHGVIWAPAYGYYGGGFWGAFAIGVASAAVYGSIVNSTTHVTYTSYQVQQSSPGATLLSNYGLTQVQCGPPNLVVIYGPDNSVICANPNQLVAAGNYNLDTSTLSLTNA